MWIAGAQFAAAFNVIGKGIQILLRKCADILYAHNSIMHRFRIDRIIAIRAYSPANISCMLIYKENGLVSFNPLSSGTVAVWTYST